MDFKREADIAYNNEKRVKKYGDTEIKGSFIDGAMTT